MFSKEPDIKNFVPISDDGLLAHSGIGKNI